jgi:hypothetical protein
MLAQLLKSLGPKALIGLLPMILTSIGNDLKNKDADSKGKDDAAGNILIAAAPAIEAYEADSGNALRKALKALVVAINKYLAETESK